MAVSLFTKLFQKHLKRFFSANGREPQTPREWMDIKDQATREINQTKGVPPGPKKPPFQGWNPKVIQGGKGIESLLESGVVKKGVAPKTTKETLKTKKDRGILLRDADEDIARIKRENKQAIEDFKQKEYDRRVKAEEDKMAADEDYIGDIIDPEESGIEIISGTSKKGKEISEKLGITARPGFPIKESGKADLKLVKTKKRDRPSIRLIKNFDQELDDITLAQEGYNLQEIGIIKRAREVMKKEGQNPDDALAWVRGEMADDAGVDFEDFMPDFDWGDFPGKAEGGRIGMMYGGDPGFAFEYGGSWADWHDQHRDTMPVEQYIQTKLPKERLPFREMQSGGRAGYDNGGLSSPRFNHPDKRQGILGSGVTWSELIEGIHPFMYSPGMIERTKRDIVDPIFKKKLKWDELDEYYKQLEMDEDMRDPENVPRRGEQYAASGGIARAGFPFGGKALKAIRDAWRANKTWGVGGPPYKPEKTSFDIKALTKKNLGQEYSFK